MDISGDGKKKKGGRMRTVTFASPKDATDAKYQQGVKKLEEAFGTRGGYVIGEGALNKNDAMYMMEEDEKRRAMERARKEEEAARFRRMVVKERTLKDVKDERAGVSGENIGDIDADDKAVDGTGPFVGAARRAMGNKRRKTAKELLRVKKVGEAKTGFAETGVSHGSGYDDGRENEEERGGEAAEGEEENGVGLTTLLFGEYDDSD